MSEALEIEIERAWSGLGDRPVKLFLTPTGRIVRAVDAGRCTRAEFMGRFSSAIGLADFRAEVFHVWEGMRR